MTITEAGIEHVAIGEEVEGAIDNSTIIVNVVISKSGTITEISGAGVTIDEALTIVLITMIAKEEASTIALTTTTITRAEASTIDTTTRSVKGQSTTATGSTIALKTAKEVSTIKEGDPMIATITIATTTKTEATIRRITTTRIETTIRTREMRGITISRDYCLQAAIRR